MRDKIEKLWLSIASFCIGLIVKSYLTSYVHEKGKNLATKEDIKEITQKTEEVKVEFKKEIESLSAKIDFDYKYSYKQYSDLYANLYAIVAQSEYLRYFFNEYQDMEFARHEIPFIETSIKRDSGEQNTEITEFDKKLIYDFIINNAGLASPELLKLAVAYRFANTYYEGSSQKLDAEEIKEAFNDEELRLIRAIVKRIVSEYNTLRKILKLDYSEREFKNGILNFEEDNK